MYVRKVSIEEKILTLLYHPRYKYIGVSFDELDSFMNSYKRQSVANTLSALSKKGFIMRDRKTLKILSEGRKYIRSREDRLVVFKTFLPKNKKKNQLILFDIPNSRNTERQWFRLHLKKFGYTMVQQSVWLGPPSLSKDFIKYLEAIGLSQYIKMFKIADSQKKLLE